MDWRRNEIGQIPTNAERVESELNAACISNQEIAEYLSECPPYELKDILCDMIGVNHHTSKEDLLKLIGEKI